MCSLAEVRAGQLDFTQLFVNGKRQIRARFPNYDPEGVVNQAGLVERARFDPQLGLDRPGYVLAAGAGKWPHQAFYYDPRTFTQKRWAKPHEAVVHIFRPTIGAIYSGRSKISIGISTWSNSVWSLTSRPSRRPLVPRSRAKTK